MNIRMAAPSDIPGLLSLLRQVGGVHHRLRPDIFRSGAQKYDEAALLALLRDADRPIFVAEDDGFLAGYCFCILRQYREDPVLADRREFYIDDLCVDEARRGMGIASALYRYVCGYAAERKCRFITLNVWCGNDSAMGFYERMGLRPRNITMEMPLEEN